MRTLQLVAAVLGMIAAFLGQVHLGGRLRRHRMDIRVDRHTTLRKAEALGTLNPWNYDSAGRKLVPWLWVLVVVWFLCLAAMILLLSWPSAAELETVRPGP